jgi:hypothetical protein
MQPINRLRELTILVLLSCLTFAGAFWIQVHLLTVFDYMPKASLFFLPAGVRLLMFIVARTAGLVGVSLGTLLTLAMDTSWIPPHPHDYISSLVFFCVLPYLGTIGIQRLLNVHRSLIGVSMPQIIGLAVGASVINGCCINLYMTIEGDYAPLGIGTLAAAFGDITGIAFTLFLVSIYPQVKSLLSK